MDTTLLLAAYCACIVAASLAGGWLPALLRLTHTRMQLVISFVSGLMLGVGLLHMLPHAIAELKHTGEPAVELAMRWLVVGLLAMFFLIRAFHFHQHEISAEPAAGASAGAERESPFATPHDHDHDDRRHGSAGDARTHQLTWAGIFLGLAVHTLIDGMALAASVQAEARNGGGILLGAGTFLAILLHKPLDAVTITSVMIADGWSPAWRNTVNTGFALMCPLGVALFAVGIERLTVNPAMLVGCALAFSAGVFLCISLGDLLPEVEFHSHDRVKLSLALLLGIALAWAIGLIEPGHVHNS